VVFNSKTEIGFQKALDCQNDCYTAVHVKPLRTVNFSHYLVRKIIFFGSSAGQYFQTHASFT